MKKHLLVCAGFLTVVAAGAAAGDFETAAIQARIDEASARGGGVVSIPAARHIVGQLDLRSNGFCGDPACDGENLQWIGGGFEGYGCMK